MAIDQPAPSPLGVSDDRAAALCRDWMVHLGAGDTVVASGTVRTVCDLFSSHYLAWVDNKRGNLESAMVMRAAMVAEWCGVRKGRRSESLPPES